MAMPMNERSWNTKLNRAVVGPNAASCKDDTCPQQALSIRDIIGSARTNPSAGRAKRSIDFSSVVVVMGWLGAVSSSGEDVEELGIGWVLEYNRRCCGLLIDFLNIE